MARGGVDSVWRVSQQNASGTTASEPTEASLSEADRRLQTAQLTGDVAALDELLDDRLVFTGGPDGGVYSKADDLEGHRSGVQVMSRVEEESLAVLVDGSLGITWFLGTLEGVYAGTPFLVRLRYTRTWVHDAVRGWRLVAAHSSPAL
jgi:hypothetical protein